MFGSEVESIKALREATEVLTSQDPDRLFDDQLEHSVVELHRLRSCLDAVWYRHVGELESRNTFLHDGYTSLAAWIAHRCGLAWGRAKHVIGIARNLAEMPQTQAAFTAGEVDLIAVRLLVKARARNVELFGRDEKILVDAARDLTPRDFSKAIAYWVDAADAEAAVADAAELYARRRLHLSSTFQDMVAVDGELDPESGQVVSTAVAALVDSWNRDNTDTRTAAQRRADALVDICRYYLDYADTPQTGGKKPHVSLVVDLERVLGGEGRSEYPDGTIITREAALRILCDCSISRIITKGASEVLDVGRRTRTVSAAQRRALAIMYPTCRWPGCDRDFKWCDIHHEVPWVEGGRTDLKHLGPYCRPHHIAKHHEIPCTGHDP